MEASVACTNCTFSSSSRARVTHRCIPCILCTVARCDVRRLLELARAVESVLLRGQEGSLAAKYAAIGHSSRLQSVFLDSAHCLGTLEATWESRCSKRRLVKDEAPLTHRGNPQTKTSSRFSIAVNNVHSSAVS